MSSTNQQILNSYSVSTASKEIVDIILKSGPSDQSFMWQSYPNRRVIFQVRTLDIDLAKHKVRVAYDGSGALVDPQRPVYVKVSFRETVFKGEVAHLARHEVSLNIPTEVRVREFREAARSSFAPGVQFLTMRPYIAHLRPDQLPTMNLNMKDVSQRGLGIYVSDANLHFFKKGRFLELIALGGQELPRALLAQVVYIQRQRGGRAETHRGAENRIGLKMLDLIPTSILDAFANNASGRKAPIEELMNSDIVTQEFKDMLSNEVTRTLKKLKQRPAIAKYLAQLEILRGQDDYLPEHIQVLGMICTFLARTMNWVSEASMEKFIYASFIHDAPLFQYPRLARIHSRAEFDARKGQLTEEEKKAFLTAPEVAAALAMADPGAPPDVASMLSMQKELPDHTGFPLAIGHSKITPMAALFIIAHSLTDEIMENPAWSLQEWLPKAKQRYKGGNFNKVLTALDSVKITLKRS